MSTSNRRQVSPKTHKMLWGRAASRCAFPDCHKELVMDGNDLDAASLVGQECHIVAKEPEGPRGDSPLSSKQRDEYENLILLCNIHHKVIDDQPHTYPVEHLHQMKAEHEQWVRQSLQGTSPLFTVPYFRNPLFTGREDILDTLHDRLITTQATALTQPQAIHGLGGIGKTQIAIEYAYTYRNKYQAVLWVRAATRETLTLDYTDIAHQLHLPLEDEQDSELIMRAVKEWLATHTNWLLILDNADDVHVVNEFVPPHRTGHILLTSRAQTTGKIAQSIEVKPMNTDDAVLLLLRCAHIVEPNELLTHTPDEQRREAETLVKELGALPLALDQAGAYIEETQTTLARYRTLYQQQRKALLAERGERAEDHPESVTVTFSLSFASVQQTHPTAADILRLCAFFDADAIPEELLTQEVPSMPASLSQLAGKPHELNKTLKTLLHFSLIERNAETEQISIHRLVQAVIQDEMDADTYQQWAQQAIRVVYAAFPEVDVSTWELCRRYLAHAQACISIVIEKNYTFSEAVRLLDDVASYENDHALYAQAESLCQRALAIREQVLGAEHPDTAMSLYNLAYLYKAQGKYSQAEPLYQRALAIQEQTLGLENPETARSLNNLAILYEAQGKSEQAEPLLQRALAIWEQVLGPMHPNTALSLNNLAMLYEAQGKCEQAELLLQRALAIQEHELGPMHPNTATSLNNLAMLYDNQGKPEQAEPLYQRALAIQEQVLGVEDPFIARSLNNLAYLYAATGKYC